MPKNTSANDANREGQSVYNTVNRRDVEIYMARQSGLSPMAVAREYDLRIGVVQSICKRVEKYLTGKFSGQVEEIKRGQTAFLFTIYREAMRAWEASKLNTVKRATRIIAGKQPETTVTVEGQHGDARFLREAMRALTDIRRIWGAEVSKSEIDVAMKFTASAAIKILEDDDWYGIEHRRMALEERDRERIDIVPESGDSGAVYSPAEVDEPPIAGNIEPRPI